jgi:hypothetical protein
MTGCSKDVTRLARQILNRSIAHRTIPKQECMVELADLPLVICSESFETISLSGSYRITSSTHRDLVSRYRRIAPTDPQLSLHAFATQELRRRKAEHTIIPHFVGANGQPKYPPTKQYARTVLLVHKPWKSATPPRLSDAEWISSFLAFVKSDDCPKSVALEYARVKERHRRRRPAEAVASEECYDAEVRADIDGDTRDILSLITTHSRASDPFFSVNDHQFNRGLNYDWSIRHLVSH